MKWYCKDTHYTTDNHDRESDLPCKISYIKTMHKHGGYIGLIAINLVSENGAHIIAAVLKQKCLQWTTLVV